MMVTSEDRKEAVKALHDLCDGCETVSDYDLAKALCLVAVSRNAYSSDSVLRIADLIEPEPTVDRDALLKLADDWIKQARYLLMSRNIDVYEFNLAVMYKDSADTIREACGEEE